LKEFALVRHTCRLAFRHELPVTLFRARHSGLN
jgi:hypothetical protein